ncbi:uncharacterized protein LOC129594062 isoform X2 [Paramacrobiotus metropolitanus]|uniref:uncharacterized protein LOC129594062 isoform X2 n=1 Tax=Paramacrobiotus metropolitanus TaxID=2943436 RepID=UPI002445BE75|nr:uncharacterized protein LOC129594062 isoform X2 [Paramacrobiotus metropolitanus]
MPPNRNRPLDVKSRLGFQRPRPNQNNALPNRPRKLADRLGHPRNFPLDNQDDGFDQYGDDDWEAAPSNNQNAPFRMRVTDRLGFHPRSRDARFPDDADNVLDVTVRQRNGRSVRFGDDAGNGFGQPAPTDLRHKINARHKPDDLRSHLNHMRHENADVPLEDPATAMRRVYADIANAPLPDEPANSHGFRPLKINVAFSDEERHIRIQGNPDSPASIDMGKAAKQTMKSTMINRLGPVPNASTSYAPSSPPAPGGWKRHTAKSPEAVGFTPVLRPPAELRNGRAETSRPRPPSPVEKVRPRPPVRKRIISPPRSDEPSPPRPARQTRVPVDKSPPRATRIPIDKNRRKHKISPPSSDREQPRKRFSGERKANRYEEKRDMVRKDIGRRRERSATPEVKRERSLTSAPLRRARVSPYTRRKDIRSRSHDSDEEASNIKRTRRPVLKPSRSVSDRVRVQASSSARTAQPSTSRIRETVRKEKRQIASPPRRKERARQKNPIVYDKVSSPSYVSSAGSDLERDDRSLSAVSGDYLDQTENVSDVSPERPVKRQRYASDDEYERSRVKRRETEYDNVESGSDEQEDSRMEEAFDNVSPDDEDWDDDDGDEDEENEDEDEEDGRTDDKKQRRRGPATPEEESDEEIDHYEMNAGEHRGRRDVAAGGKRGQATDHVRTPVAETTVRGAQIEHNAVGGLASLPLSVPRMMPPMISVTPHEIHQQLAVFHQHHQNQKHQQQQQQQQQKKQQMQNVKQLTAPVMQAPAGTRIKPPVAPARVAPTKEADKMQETVKPSSKLNQAPLQSSVPSNPVKLQQIRLKPPPSNLKPIALTATSPNTDGAGRASPLEPGSASSSTNGREAAGTSEFAVASRVSDMPRTITTFKKTERRATANKTGNLEIDATHANNNPPGWSLIPAGVRSAVYSRFGQVDLSWLEREALENDPRIAVYCQRTGVPMPERPAADVAGDAAGTSGSRKSPDAASTVSQISPVVKAEEQHSHLSNSHGSTSQSDSDEDDVKIKQELPEDIHVKVEDQEMEMVNGRNAAGWNGDVEYEIKNEPKDEEDM